MAAMIWLSMSDLWWTRREHQLPEAPVFDRRVSAPSSRQYALCEM